MKTFIIPVIMLLVALWGLGEFHIQLSPFKMKLEKPLQVIGILFIVIGLVLFREQTAIDTRKAIVAQLEEELQNQVEEKLKSNQ